VRAVLALDTATEACSAALLRGDEVIGRFSEGGLSHARRILGMVDAVLEEAGMTLSMLDGIAASIGPGAFTGVRISVAVAQGLAFGAGLPVVAVTTLEALASKIVSSGSSGAVGALACLDARMGEVYWGCFAADARRGLVATTTARVGPPASVALPARAGLPLSAAPPANGVSPATDVYRGIGRGFAAYPVLAALRGLQFDPLDAQALPDAREFARLGALRLGLGEGLDPADLSPLYLRDKVALTEAERGVK
jgi:tRNA threonylcarbamoyladenosine biosynthesis protein TsaB